MMPDQPLLPLPTLDLTLPAIPPRSRLYPLPPIGLGSPEVESLTSYLTRLTKAHCVPLTKLAELEFAPLFNKGGPLTRAKFNHGAKNLNGGGDWTAMTLAVLEKLTQGEGFRGLTLYPWRNVLAREKLLRPHLAWCPRCYAEWRQAGQTLYNPLLWHVEAVEICPRHRQALCHHCPHPDCQRRLYLVNNQGQLGYCPSCQRWLGMDRVESQRPDIEWPWQLWLSDQLAQMFTAAPHLPADPHPHMLAHNLGTRLGTAGLTQAAGLARQIGMSPSVIYRWLNHAQPPRLDLLAKLCYHLDQPLLEILTAKADPAEIPTRRTRPSVDVSALARHLAPFLNERPPCSAHQVARQLGVRSSVIRAHFPEQYQRLVERYEQARQRQLTHRNEQLQHQLRAFLPSDETPPPALREVARRLQMKPSTLTDACPELCRLIVQQDRAYRQARRVQAEVGLKQILAADETPPPSVAEAAARLGENIKYLYKLFPELCRQITRRRSDYQPSQKAKWQLKDHPQLQHQFTAILAGEEKPPPSLREVARRLNCGYTTLRQCHAELCDQLRQQAEAYHQAQISDLPTRLAEILAAHESPAPSLRAVSHRLGVPSYLLQKICPDMGAEILRRAQAERQAAKQQRQVFLDQVLASADDGPPPALAEVAKSLHCSDAGLAEQFPEAGRLIVRRYQAYKATEKRAWQAALQAALTAEQTPPPTLIEVARQLGQANSQKLRFHFPHLCQQLQQRRQADLTHSHQTLLAQLEAIVAESQAPPPTLMEVARRLGCDETMLKRRFLPQVQALLTQRQDYLEAKKRLAEQALRAILEDEPGPPASLKALAKELGYTYDTLQHYFPKLTAAVLAKRQAFIKARNRQRQQQLEAEVKRLTAELYQQGVDPTLYQLGLRLPSPKMTIAPEVRQAWREARQALGLPT